MNMRYLIIIIAMLLGLTGAASATNVTGGSSVPGIVRWAFTSEIGVTGDSNAVMGGGYCSLTYSGTDTMELYAVPSSSSAYTDGTEIGTGFSSNTTVVTTFQPPQPYLLARTTVATAGDGVLTVRCTNTQLAEFSGGGAGAGDFVINEVMVATLRTSVEDDDFDNAGFIELMNTGVDTASLDGFTLTASGSQYGSFTFPAVTVTSGNFIRVWATGKDRQSIGDVANLHTPFWLEGVPSLELRNNVGGLVDTIQLAGVYPDLSYGLCQESCGGRTHEFFSTSSEGSANTAANGAVRVEVAAPFSVTVPPRRVTQVPIYYTPTTGGEAVPIGSTATYSLDFGWMELNPDDSGQLFTHWDATELRRVGLTPSQPLHLSQDTLTVSKGTDDVDVNVTVSGWEGGHSEIEWKARITGDSRYGYIERILNGSRLQDGWIYFGVEGDDTIWRTNDGLATRESAGTRPTGYSDWGRADFLVRTGTFGDFYLQWDDTAPERNVKIFRSTNGSLTSWTQQDVDGATTHLRDGPLQEGFDFYWDGVNTGYFAIGEYDACGSGAVPACNVPDGVFNQIPHRVRVASYVGGTGAPDGDFTIVKTYAAQDDWNPPTAAPQVASHVHTVWFDDVTGDLWINTGDDSIEGTQERPAIWLEVSYDFGSSWGVVAGGRQEYRNLSMWQDDECVYTNVDSSATQSVYCLPRTQRSPTWPSITPYLESGETLTGGKAYIAYEFDASTTLPVGLGERFTADTVPPITLATDDAVRDFGSIGQNWTNPTDYRIEVAKLDNGDMYYSMWDTTGDVRIVAGARDGTVSPPENISDAQRGNITYLWGIEKTASLTWDVQEISHDVPYPSGSGVPSDEIRRQLMPRGFDSAGNLYFEGAGLYDRQRVGRLAWNNTPAGLQMGIDFTRDPDMIGCWQFENATLADIGEDGCDYTSLFENEKPGSTPALTQKFLNPGGLDVGGLGDPADQDVGPLAGMYSVDTTDSPVGSQRGLWYDDVPAYDFADQRQFNYTQGCFVKPDETSDVSVFGTQGPYDTGGTAFGVWMNETGGVWAAESIAGNLSKRISSNTATVGSDWHFVADRRFLQTGAYSTALANSLGGNGGFYGEQDIYFDGVLTDGVHVDQLNDANWAGAPMMIGNSSNNAKPPTNLYPVPSVDGLTSDCFYSRKAYTGEQLCQICSCGLDGKGVTDVGRKAACNSCTMAQPVCESDPFSAVTLPGDTDPPLPDPLTAAEVAFSGVTETAMNLTVTGVTDDTPPITYSFDCVGCDTFDRGFGSNVYAVTGLTSDTSYVWDVRAKDNLGNESASASTGTTQATNGPPGPGISGDFATTFNGWTDACADDQDPVSKGWCRSELGVQVFATRNPHDFVSSETLCWTGDCVVFNQGCDNCTAPALGNIIDDHDAHILAGGVKPGIPPTSGAFTAVIAFQLMNGYVLPDTNGFKFMRWYDGTSWVVVSILYDGQFRVAESGPNPSGYSGYTVVNEKKYLVEVEVDPSASTDNWKLRLFNSDGTEITGAAIDYTSSIVDGATWDEYFSPMTNTPGIPTAAIYPQENLSYWDEYCTCIGLTCGIGTGGDCDVDFPDD